MTTTHNDTQERFDAKKVLQKISGKRPGKPCGKSFIAADRKCGSHNTKNATGKRKLTEEGKKAAELLAAKVRARKGLADKADIEFARRSRKELLAGITNPEMRKRTKAYQDKVKAEVNIPARKALIKQATQNEKGETRKMTVAERRAALRRKYGAPDDGSRIGKLARKEERRAIVGLGAEAEQPLGKRKRELVEKASERFGVEQSSKPRLKVVEGGKKKDDRTLEQLITEAQKIGAKYDDGTADLAAHREAKKLVGETVGKAFEKGKSSEVRPNAFTEQLAKIPDNNKRPSTASREAGQEAINTMRSHYRKQIESITETSGFAKSHYQFKAGQISPDEPGTYYVGQVLGIRRKGDPHPTPTNERIRNAVDMADQQMRDRVQRLVNKAIESGDGAKLPKSILKEYAPAQLEKGKSAGDRIRESADKLKVENEVQKTATVRILTASAKIAANQDKLIDEAVDMANQDLGVKGGKTKREKSIAQMTLEAAERKQPEPKQPTAKGLSTRIRASADTLQAETEKQIKATSRILGAAAKIASNQDKLIEEMSSLAESDLDAKTRRAKISRTKNDRSLPPTSPSPQRKSVADINAELRKKNGITTRKRSVDSADEKIAVS